MNIEKVKNYSKTTFIDKYDNPIYLRDIVKTASNKIAIILAISDDDKFVVGFTDGNVAKVKPEKLTRLDTIISSLNTIADSLENKASNYSQFIRKNYTEYYLDIFSFVRYHLFQKTFKKRLYEDDFKDNLINQFVATYHNCYLLNNKYYKYKDVSKEELILNTPFFISPYLIYVNAFEFDKVKTFESNKTKIYDLIMDYYTKQEQKNA